MIESGELDDNEAIREMAAAELVSRSELYTGQHSQITDDVAGDGNEISASKRATTVTVPDSFTWIIDSNNGENKKTGSWREVQMVESDSFPFVGAEVLDADTNEWDAAAATPDCFPWIDSNI